MNDDDSDNYESGDGTMTINSKTRINNESRPKQTRKIVTVVKRAEEMKALQNDIALNGGED